jgi:predicted metal-binding membrane protein
VVAIRLERFDRLIVVAIAALAWSLLWAFGHTSGFAASLVSWNVMMVAMMLPSLTPWLLLFEPHQSLRFSLGYFAVWALYALAAAGAQQLLRVEHGVSGPGAAAVLIIAGAYQFTPLKQSCLRKCRSPLGHVLTYWQSGRAFWMRVGLGHGMNCLSCCWALMGVAFALGVMNLGWMAAVTVLIVAEKMLPRGELFSRVTGGTLILVGAGWLVLLVLA